MAREDKGLGFVSPKAVKLTITTEFLSKLCSYSITINL